MTCALALGIVFGLTGIQLPSLFNKVISSASVCMGPMGMLLTGLTLAGFSFKKLISNKTAYLFTVIRLVILPLLIYVSFRLLHLDSTLPYAVTIACMPTGLNTIIFPKLVGEDCSIGARIAFISHLSSCLTIPIWLSLLYSA
jgi:predicted permease